MKNSIKVATEIKKDRSLISFDNNLLTEIQGYEYILDWVIVLRFKDSLKLAGPKKVIK